MMRTLLLSTTLVAALAIAGTAPAFASEHSDSDRSDAAMVSNAKTTLVQAIATAEQDAGGKALKARADNENGSLVYKIEVAKGDVIQMVTVDAATGKVTAKTADARDEDRNGDDEHSNGEHEDDGQK